MAELPAFAGCPFQYIPELGGHFPHHSEKMETPLAGLFVAGNITGIESGKIECPKEQPLDFPLPHTLEKAVQKWTSSLKRLGKISVPSVKAIQFNLEIESGRRKMNELWVELYGGNKVFKKIG